METIQDLNKQLAELKIELTAVQKAQYSGTAGRAPNAVGLVQMKINRVKAQIARLAAAKPTA